MRACLIALAVLILPSPAWAGLYVDNDIEPISSLAVPLEKVYSTVLGLRGAAADHKGQQLDRFSPRAFYLRQLAELEARRKDGRLSPADRANLGGCLIRLGRVSDAVNVLRGGLSSGHFTIHANLATAHFLEGDYRQAIRVQKLLLDTWPAVLVVGPRRQHLAWYRECERAFLQLMELREKQSARRAGPAELDALFPKVRFVGAEGKYQPGAIARRFADELPPAAFNTILQLGLWLPGDLRLFWLLGELLNAGGHVEWAHMIFQSLLTRPKDDSTWEDNRFRDLKVHRDILERALPIMKNLRSGDLPVPLFCVAQAIPMPNLAPGVAGPVACATAAWASLVALPEHKRQWQEPPRVALPPEQPAPGPPAEAAPLPFNWRHVSTSFAFGALASALIGLQWREWQRRRARRAAEPSGEEGVGGSDERIIATPARDDRITGPPAAAGPS